MSWLIDGVPIPNTNIASNLGPQIDPKDIDTVEMQRGSYAADYGDRTYGIFNVAPRTGFERNNEAELVLSAGNFYQTDDQLNFGGHTNRFAYYASVNGNRTNLGLANADFGGDSRCRERIWRIYVADLQPGFEGSVALGRASAARFLTRFRLIPTTPIRKASFCSDANRENDSFVTFSWVRTFNPGLLLTVSPFFHYNSANYQSSPLDLPSSATQDRSSKYEGGQATLAWVKERNNLRAGFYGFAQQDHQLFGLIFNDGSQPNLSPPDVENPDGSLVSVYAEDQFRATSWLTLNAGVRQTHFSGGVVENATESARWRFGPHSQVELGLPRILRTLLPGAAFGHGLRTADPVRDQPKSGFRSAAR